MGTAEFDMISRIRAHGRRAQRSGACIGTCPRCSQCGGRQLVVTADRSAGVHFPATTAPADIGWKALAVNLSDLAAMGAQPAWCTLALSLPEASDAWIERFLDGFLALAAQHDCALIGGDTTRGPLSISVTAMGLVEPGQALRRAGARPGDDLWVTGTLGDAAAALGPALEGRQASAALQLRLDRPIPRVAAGQRLPGLASACIDLSDGLLADLAHVCHRSGVGAEVELPALPASAGLLQLEPATRWPLQACGGDDYELCFTATPRHRETILQAMNFAGVSARASAASWPGRACGHSMGMGRSGCRRRPATSTSADVRPLADRGVIGATSGIPRVG